MSLTEARASIGRKVWYRPGGTLAYDGVVFTHLDVGSITRVEDPLVLVQFEGDSYSRAMHPKWLVLVPDHFDQAVTP